MVGNTIRTLFKQTRGKIILMVLNNLDGEMSSQLMEHDEVRPLQQPGISKPAVPYDDSYITGHI